MAKDDDLRAKIVQMQELFFEGDWCYWDYILKIPMKKFFDNVKVEKW